MRVRKDFDSSISQWATIVEKTTDLFMRMNTDQAEIVATVMYAANSLRKKDNGSLTETQVLESVMQWKQKRRPSLDKSVVASIIRNLGMLRWLDVKPDASLPVSDDEALASVNVPCNVIKT